MGENTQTWPLIFSKGEYHALKVSMSSWFKVSTNLTTEFNKSL